MLQGLPKNFVFHPDRRGSAGRTASSISTVVGADLYSSWQRSCFYRQIYFWWNSTTEALVCDRAVWARQEVGQRSGIVHPVDFQNKTLSTLQHNKVQHLNDKQTNNKTIQLHSYWPTVEAHRSRRNDEITQSERLDDIRQTWRFWNQIWDMTLRWGGTKQRRAQWTRGVEGDILLVRLFGWFCEKFSAGERFGKVNLEMIDCKTADRPSTLCVKYQVCSDANMLLLQLNVCPRWLLSLQRVFKLVAQLCRVTASEILPYILVWSPVNVSLCRLFSCFDILESEWDLLKVARVVMCSRHVVSV